MTPSLHWHYSGSSFPSNLVYSTDFCSPSSCQLGSSLYNQEICCEPIRTQTSHVVSSPCLTSCYHPRTSTFFSPCWTTHLGSLGFRSSKDCSLNPGSKGCCLLGCGSSGFRPLGYGVWGSPTLGYGSRSCHSTYLDFWPIC
ncbi:keratin-associated protein 13-2-like [Oryx dammah]|uniref:keratin-associated protein 13-2-like n=1 Tax=Oryx dammah TaxID=59534 RepID=UPI001A9B5400|nr:keratin-associated protein 13-2-like [Oryx dammah]